MKSSIFSVVIQLLIFIFLNVNQISAETLEDTQSTNDLADEQVQIGNAVISVFYSHASLKNKSNLWLSWIESSAGIVSQYYEGFPVSKVSINLVSFDGVGVKTGKAFQGKQMPQLILWVGSESQREDLNNDWVLVHELIHLATANLPRKNHWLEEGLSVYVESIARAQAGNLDSNEIWRQFFSRMPNGQPAAGDQGLDNTATWGRTYWGGAVFCLLADVAIRQQSQNRKSLRDSLQSVIQAGLTLNQSASIDNIIEAMDRPLSQAVLRPLYKKFANSNTAFQLDALWHSLGVSIVNNQLQLNDSASLATIRKKITALPGKN